MKVEIVAAESTYDKKRVVFISDTGTENTFFKGRITIQLQKKNYIDGNWEVESEYTDITVSDLERCVKILSATK